MTVSEKRRNIDLETVEGFGDEWSAFDQTALDAQEHRTLFDKYFSIFPVGTLAPDAEGFDLGCKSCLWAALVAEHVRLLHCIDPSERALAVARRRMT